MLPDTENSRTKASHIGINFVRTDQQMVRKKLLDITLKQKQRFSLDIVQLLVCRHFVPKVSEMYCHQGVCNQVLAGQQAAQPHTLWEPARVFLQLGVDRRHLAENKLTGPESSGCVLQHGPLETDRRDDLLFCLCRLRSISSRKNTPWSHPQVRLHEEGGGPPFSWMVVRILFSLSNTPFPSAQLP